MTGANDSRVQVRSSRCEDAAFISELASDAFAEFSNRPEEATVSLMEQGVTLVAERVGRRLGFVSLAFPKAGIAHVNAIAVSYAERGTGVGAELLQAAERCRRPRGAGSLELFTADGNLEALELFFKHGFTIEGRVAGYYARGQNACLLAKAVAR